MKKRLLAKIAALALAAAIPIAGCASTAARTETGGAAATPSAPSGGAQTDAARTQTAATDLGPVPSAVSGEDLDGEWDENAATKITLNNGSITVDGAGANAGANIVTITSAGTYVVSGILADGQIAVAASSADTVRLVLSGADVTNKSGAAIYASQCDKLILTLAPGTSNNMTDGGSDYVYADETEQEPNAAVFCKDDLTINGTGALTVNAGFNNGIGTKDDLLIAGGAIYVTAANHGIRGNDSVTVLDGEFTIDAGTDGINSKGDVFIGGGVLNIESGDDGVHADAALTITGGTVNIPVCYEGIEGLSVTIGGGDVAVTADDDAINAAGGVDSTSRFGAPMEADSFASNGERFVRITGGTLDLYALRDGIDSNGDIFLEGGTVKISGPSQGMEGAIDLDGALTVTGGELITAGSVLSPSADSAQPVLLVSYTARQAAGSVIGVKDANGNTLLEYTAKTDYSMSGFTSPAFKTGEMVSLFIDGVKRTDITLNGTVTGISDDGGTYSGVMGGGRGNWGGMTPPDGAGQRPGGGTGQRRGPL